MKSSERIRRLGLVAATAALAIGCGYGPVSPAAYEHAKSLYTLANMKAAASLDSAEAAIEGDLAAKNISSREAAWLRAIAADCHAERWADAQKAARRMMEDQADR